MRARDLRVALGLDWGNASFGCVLWGAALPDGDVSIFDELKFRRTSAKDVADAVKAKCADWKLLRVPVAYCDPSLLPAKKGELGEWIGLTLQRHGMPVVRVSNDRVNGWQRVHEALGVSPKGTPWLTVHPRCRYLIRTLPLMIQAKDNPEDVDTDSDDHAADALRYLLMGGLRPSAPRKSTAPVVPYSMAWFRQRFASEPAGVLAP
jgi:hypothetical protein